MGLRSQDKALSSLRTQEQRDNPELPQADHVASDDLDEAMRPHSKAKAGTEDVGICKACKTHTRMPAARPQRRRSDAHPCGQRLQRHVSEV